MLVWVMVLSGSRIWIKHYEQLLLHKDTFRSQTRNRTVPSLASGLFFNIVGTVPGKVSKATNWVPVMTFFFFFDVSIYLIVCWYRTW
jgi:hypothetical protein